MPGPDTPVELEPPSTLPRPLPAVDRRPRVPEPPPVRLVAVRDVRLPAAAGAVPLLDNFYVGLFAFERDARAGPGELAYRAENYRLVFDVFRGPSGPPPPREGYRPVGIELKSLADAERKLIDAELEYTRQKAVMTGVESIVLLDPAGNWVELFELREIR
jgi:hypothetical protein